MLRRLLLTVATLATVIGGVAVLAELVPAKNWAWNRSASADASTDAAPLSLGWEDLVPEGFEPAPDPFATITSEQLEKLFDGSPESNAELAEIETAMAYAPVDETLDGRLVTLPGYVVPLDFDGQTRLEEFLLVPYFGACIHTPPPPANQIVMAELDEPVDIGNGYEPVLLRGILHAETVNSALAEAGYRMDVQSVQPYELR